MAETKKQLNLQQTCRDFFCDRWEKFQKNRDVPDDLFQLFKDQIEPLLLTEGSFQDLTILEATDSLIVKYVTNQMVKENRQILSFLSSNLEDIKIKIALLVLFVFLLIGLVFLAGMYAEDRLRIIHTKKDYTLDFLLNQSKEDFRYISVDIDSLTNILKKDVGTNRCQNIRIIDEEEPFCYYGWVRIRLNKK